MLKQTGIQKLRKVGDSLSNQKNFTDSCLRWHLTVPCRENTIITFPR